jgi:hypothetical protein
LGVVAEDLRVSGLAAIIELVERPCGELANRVAHEVHGANTEEEDELDSKPQQEVVTLEDGADPRTLYFHGDGRAILQSRFVDLSDGRGGDWIDIERQKHILR